MTRTIIRNWLDASEPTSIRDEVNLAREIAQTLMLRAITEAGMQPDLYFHGGTCLRLFHGLPRFSEDLDYLLGHSAKLDFSKIEQSIGKATAPYGFVFRVVKRDKKVSALTLEDRTLFATLKTSYRRDLDAHPVAGRIRIKIEVNTAPPLGAKTAALTRIQHIDYAANCCDLPTLFAGKVHSVLSRKKGRDWYDLLWYSGKTPGLNTEFLRSACEQNGVDISRGAREALLDRVKKVSPVNLIHEVEPLLPSSASLQQWDLEGFHEAIHRLAIEPKGAMKNYEFKRSGGRI